MGATAELAGPAVLAAIGSAGCGCEREEGLSYATTGSEEASGRTG